MSTKSYNAAEKYGYTIIQMETDKDHVHILLEYSPKVSVSDIVKQLKQYSTFQMWQYHKEYLSRQYWRHQILWPDGYFACSIGQVSQEIIEKIYPKPSLMLADAVYPHA